MSIELSSEIISAVGGALTTDLATYRTASQVQASVDAAVLALVNSAPTSLNTLGELATAIGNDANFANTVSTALLAKVATARQIATTGLASGGGDLSSDRTITVTAATNAEGIAGASTTTAMTPASTKAATDAIVAALVNAAPSNLNTLGELAAAIGNDASFSATVTAALNAKISSARLVSTSGLASGGGDLTVDRTINVPAANNSEAITGTLTTKAMTPASTKAATDSIVTALVNGAPAGLDTFGELAAALGNDASFSTTTTAALAGKVAVGRLVNTSGLATGGGDLSADRTITVTAASNTEAVTGTATNRAMTPQSTKAALDAATSALVNSAPAGLDTLGEIATSIGNDVAFANTVTNALAGKTATTRQVLSAGLATGGGDLTADRTITVPAASNTETIAGTLATKAVTPQSNKAALDAAVAALVNSAPSNLDTLGELATAVGNDPTFANTVTTALATKANNSTVALKLNTADFANTLLTTTPDSYFQTTGWVDATAANTVGPLVGGRAYQRRPRVAGVRCLAHFANVASVQGGGSITGLADNTNSDALYGLTSLRLTHTGAGSLVNLAPASTVVATDVTGGIIRWTFKPVANLFSNMDRFQIQLHSAGTPASPTSNYHEIPVGSNSELKTRLTSQNGTGRWQKVAYAVNQFTAVGSGADLTNIIFAKLVVRAGSGLQIILDIGNIEYVPNLLTKAKCVLTFDDGYLSHYTEAAVRMAKYGFRGVAYPGALAANISSALPSYMSPTQLKHLHDDHGWQVGSQAWDTESPDTSVETNFTIAMAKQRNLHNALGLTGGEDGSYFSAVDQYTASAYPTFRKMFRSMRVFGGGNGSGPPLVFGEMFPFADDMLVRAVDAATGGWATPATNQQAHIDQAISNKGVAIFAWHNQLASAGTDRTAFDTTLAYLDSQRANIDVCTIEDLYALV